nr:CCR4-Not transcription complex subunit 1 isoform X1 [Tanacetum cinerariifolium]
MDSTRGSVNPMINNLGDCKYVAELVFLDATERGISLETVSATASLQARLLESGNNPINPLVQEAIGAGQQRYDRRLPGLDTSAATIGAPCILYAANARHNAASRLLIKNQLVTYLTLGITLRAVLDALRKPADSKTLVAATERRETPREAPPSETQDKISFIINNLSIANIEPKAKEFIKVLKEEYYPWFT